KQAIEKAQLFCVCRRKDLGWWPIPAHDDCVHPSIRAVSYVADWVGTMCINSLTRATASFFHESIVQVPSKSFGSPMASPSLIRHCNLEPKRPGSTTVCFGSKSAIG